MIVSIANQKGGVGKTTTAIALADLADRAGYRTLLIDLDPQGNVATGLGMEAGSDVYEWLVGGKPLAKVVFRVRECLDVIRSDKKTVAAQVAIGAMDFREYVLSNALEGNGYDLVIMDCPPSAGVIQTAALVASDYLVIPTTLSQFSVKGIMDIMATLVSVQRATRSTCALGGIIPTFYDRTTSETQTQLTNLAKYFGDGLWPIIPIDTRCRVATRKGINLTDMRPTPNALIGYEQNGKRIGGYVACFNRLTDLMFSNKEVNV